jgi:hypothetical protein
MDGKQESQILYPPVATKQAGCLSMQPSVLTLIASNLQKYRVKVLFFLHIVTLDGVLPWRSPEQIPSCRKGGHSAPPYAYQLANHTATTCGKIRVTVNTTAIISAMWCLPYLCKSSYSNNDAIAIHSIPPCFRNVTRRCLRMRPD